MQYEQDRARADRGIADTEYLTRELAALRIAVGEVATRDFLRSELRALMEELEERAGPPKPAPETQPQPQAQPEKAARSLS